MNDALTRRARVVIEAVLAENHVTASNEQTEEAALMLAEQLREWLISIKGAEEGSLRAAVVELALEQDD